MDLKLNVALCGVICLLYGGIMAEQSSQNWITIKDEETGLQADFPRRPLEMAFEVPFQNTPPLGQIRFYSIPVETGTLILTIFNSPKVNSDWLKKEEFYHFLENLLVPHLFFEPAVFHNQQVFAHELKKDEGEKVVSFHISYEDHLITKRMEGLAKVKKHTLYTYFYLASEETFDPELAHRFLHSVYL